MARRISRGDRPHIKTTRIVPLRYVSADGLTVDVDFLAKTAMRRLLVEVDCTTSDNRRWWRRTLERIPGTEFHGTSDNIVCRIDPARPLPELPRNVVVRGDGYAVVPDGNESWEVWGDNALLESLMTHPGVLSYEWAMTTRIPVFSQGAGTERIRSSGKPSRPSAPVADPVVSGVLTNRDDRKGGREDSATTAQDRAFDRRRADLDRPVR